MAQCARAGQYLLINASKNKMQLVLVVRKFLVIYATRNELSTGCNILLDVQRVVDTAAGAFDVVGLAEAEAVHPVLLLLLIVSLPNLVSISSYGFFPGTLYMDSIPTNNNNPQVALITNA